MKKYILGDHPEITLVPDADNAKFFRGVYKGNRKPDFGEKIKEFNKGSGKITVIGENDTKCSIIAPDIMLDKIQLILNNFIGTSIGNVENIEIE